MAVHNIADPALPLPQQIVVDTSLLLALRPTDDNPYVSVARSFVRRMQAHIAAYEMIAWLPLPVLQECWHIILANGLRRTWEGMPASSRAPNWLKAYKDQPDLLRPLLPDLSRFSDLLSAIPLTPVRLEDLALHGGTESLGKRLFDLITAYHLLPQDALILAQAERLGVNHVATLDREWRRATSFEVYTVA